MGVPILLKSKQNTSLTLGDPDNTLLGKHRLHSTEREAEAKAIKDPKPSGSLSIDFSKLWVRPVEMFSRPKTKFVSETGVELLIPSFQSYLEHLIPIQECIPKYPFH